jgi:hypothetical protein
VGPEPTSYIRQCRQLIHQEGVILHHIPDRNFQQEIELPGEMITLHHFRELDHLPLEYDERNEPVKALLRMLIQTAKASGVKVGICGQGPSDFPDFVQFLVEEGE